MGTIIVILGIAIVITCFIHIWVDNLAMKRAIGKDDSPSYISDMEHELSVARLDHENSIEFLRTELSRVIAKELPKTVKAGERYFNIKLYTKDPKYNFDTPSLIITPSQLAALKRYQYNNELTRKTLIDPKVAKYISDVRLFVMDMHEEYVSFSIWIVK